MPNWKPVCRVEEIPLQGARTLSLPSLPVVAIFRTADDGVFALLDRCPHKGGPLSQGIVFGRRVACPLHNWVIELDSGRAQAPDDGCAARVDVSVHDGAVQVDIDQLERLARTAQAGAQ